MDPNLRKEHLRKLLESQGCRHGYGGGLQHEGFSDGAMVVELKELESAHGGLCCMQRWMNDQAATTSRSSA